MSNSNKKIIVVSSPKVAFSSKPEDVKNLLEHLDDLWNDCIFKGDKDTCRWFHHYFNDNPYGVKVIYRPFVRVGSM